MQTIVSSPKAFPFSRLAGAAFALGNLLFLGNKVNEMSRLFLGRFIPDLISGEDRILIACGQLLLITGYIGFLQSYSPTTKSARIPFWLFCWGGMLTAIGHVSFMAGAPEPFFALVLLGMAIMLPGLILFGLANFRTPTITRWKWLPLCTGLLGAIGFFLFGGEEITAIFLACRTLFALGLVGMGVSLWLEKHQPLLS